MPHVWFFKRSPSSIPVVLFFVCFDSLTSCSTFIITHGMAITEVLRATQISFGNFQQPEKDLDGLS